MEGVERQGKEYGKNLVFGVRSAFSGHDIAENPSAE
jgi:hypothetical protein